MIAGRETGDATADNDRMPVSHHASRFDPWVCYPLRMLRPVGRLMTTYVGISTTVPVAMRVDKFRPRHCVLPVANGSCGAEGPLVVDYNHALPGGGYPAIADVPCRKGPSG